MISIRKIAATTVALLAYGATSLSQEMPSVVPPAPEAASLGKYTDMPVNYSSGLPQISIPMFTATSRDISVPVSLSYHAGGIRVEEIASRAGLGWNLQAGGSITRSMRGIADDVNNGWLSPKNTVTDFEDAPDDILLAGNKSLLAEDALNGGNDYEPDIFNFSYPGGSGKFFFDESGEVTFVSGSEIKVEYTLGGGTLAGITRFTITDTQGYKYYFGEYSGIHARDQTSIVQSYQDESSAGGIVIPNDRPVNHYSTWHLLAILSPISDAIVQFNYTSQNTTTLNRGTQTKMFEIQDLPNCSMPVGLRTSYIHSQNTEILLSSINFENGWITFIYDPTDRDDVPGSRALDKVILSNQEGAILKTFDLVQGYWDSMDNGPVVPPLTIPASHLTKRMYLQKVIEKGENNIQPKEYLFDYHDLTGMPNRFSYAQDVWGFYNGADNSTLIPEHLEPGEISPTPVDLVFSVIQGADRRPNFEKAKTYSLKRITYPTGGSANFTYESNGGSYLIGTDIKVANSFFGLTEESLATFHYDQVTNYREFPITVDNNHIDGTLRFNYDLDGCLGGEDPFGGPDNLTPCGLSVNLVGVSDPSYLRELSLRDGAYFNVAPGTYKLTIQVEDPASVSDAHAYITSFKNSSPYADRGEYSVGGLRILRTILDDGLDNQIIKEFSYIQNELSNDPSQFTPSGRIANQEWVFYDDNVSYCTNPLAIATQQTSTNLIAATGTGTGHITYTNVIEAQLPDDALLGNTSSTSFPNGFAVKAYDFAQDTPNAASKYFPFTPYQQPDWHRGNLIRQSQSKNEGGLVEEVQSETLNVAYEFMPNDALYKKIRALKIDRRGGQFVFSYYDIIAGANHVTGKVTKTTQDNGVVEQSTDYEYNNHYFRPDKTIINHSDGQTTISTTKYTDDSFGTELSAAEKTVLTSMVAANIFSPILSETYADDLITPLAKSLTVFGNETAGYLPVSTKIWNRDTDAFEERLVYSYTDQGNYEHLVKDGAQQVAYIWNYDNTRPTAQVTNVSDVNDIAYTSFESTGKGNWTYTGSGIAGNNLPSGAKYFDVSSSNIIKTGLDPDKKYIVSYWAKYDTLTVNNSTNITASPALTRGGWIYYQHLVSGHSSVQISGSGIIDELRLHPPDAPMNTMTYDPLRGVTSMGTPNNLFSHYIYDEHGRLYMVKDQDGNILKVNTYEYQAPVSTVQN